MPNPAASRKCIFLHIAGLFHAAFAGQPEKACGGDGKDAGGVGRKEKTVLLLVLYGRVLYGYYAVVGADETYRLLRRPQEYFMVMMPLKGADRAGEIAGKRQEKT